MKKDMLSRFEYLETRLYWGGGITARELGEACGLTRQNAQGVIAEYRRRHPGNMTFSGSLKRQIASEVFTPHYINPNPGPFLDYQRGAAMMAFYRDQEDWGGLPFHDIDRLLRPRLSTEPVREVITGLQQKQAVSIYYHAKTGTRMRDISPNQLIFASNRYHIRAYCHYTEKFLDFVLSRIVYAESTRTEWISSHEDSEWNTYVKLFFKPNEQLPAEAKDALLLDFPLDKHGLFMIPCRQALEFYVVREMLTVDMRYGCSRWARELSGKHSTGKS